MAVKARAKTDQAGIAASTVFGLGTCLTWPEAGPVVAEEVERGILLADQFPPI